MCGIVGIYDPVRSRPIDRDLLMRMNEAQFHRGPDEGGIHLDEGIGLGHRRLSIIDLASGKQPLYNEDHSVVVVYNGEIYNFQDLAAELTKRGHRFRTHSDTEVIVHAWEEWGESCVERFRGMFAFALWDNTKRCLFLARDRLGVKPLYYSQLADGRILFGSELKSLIATGQLRRELSSEAIEDYFGLGYIPDPKTIYRDVQKLAPGHVLLIRDGSTVHTPREYWDLPFKVDHGMREQDVLHEFVERLRESVRIRLVSEVPLGAFLSGGVDSSAVVAMMAELSATPVNTCSIAFNDAAYDESVYAEQVASRYGTNHFVERVDSDNYDLVDKIATIYDEPFADSSAIPTYRVCQLARKRVTVALSGDGGDENFAGYKRYRWHLADQKFRAILPAMIRRPLFGALAGLLDNVSVTRLMQARSLFDRLSHDSVQGYFQRVGVIGCRKRNALYGTGFQRELQGYSAVEALRIHARRAPTDDPLSLVQYLDMKTYLPGDILTKVDRASMANSLEVREPLLDYELMEWASSVPTSLKLKGDESKFLFKKAMEPYLPHEVLYRSKKGFAVPVAEWFRGPLKSALSHTVLSERMMQTGIFERSSLQTLISDHQSGRQDNSAALWSLLMFEAFIRRVDL